MRERLVKLIKHDNCISPATCSSKCKYVDSDDCHAERLADYLLANGVVVMPCDVGTEIKGEIVHEIDYYKSLMASGEIIITKKVYTCDKDDIRKIIFCSHPMTWEDAERALKGDKE